jgi:hypothetical protein
VSTDVQRDDEWALLHAAVARMRASVMAVVFGILGGVGLFVATAWLVLRGGDNVGVHLSLLNNYFPGYRVTWPGAFLGLFYGALSGAVLGWALAWLYNTIAFRRRPT